MRTFAVIAIMAVIAVCVSAQVVYVDINGSGADGNSWATAHTDIQSGINDAATSSEQVWVADGTYVQSGNLFFASGVEVFGGFEGAGGAEETLLSQRDVAANTTTIDLGNFYNVNISNDLGAALDGFTMANTYQSGIMFLIFNSTGVSIANLTIPDLSSDSSSLHAFLIFTGSAVSMENVVMLDDGDFSNRALEVSDGSSAIVKNCVFAGASFSEAALACLTGSDLTVVNCTIDGNSTGILANSPGTTVSVTNSIISNSTVRGADEADVGADITFNSCLFHSNSVDLFDEALSTVNGASNINGLSGCANNLDGDPKYADAANAVFTLGNLSAAIDQGDDASAPALDIVGNPRNDNPYFVNGPTGFSDIGAYEADISTLPVELSVLTID